jgi:hypothetical protein
MRHQRAAVLLMTAVIAGGGVSSTGCDDVNCMLPDVTCTAGRASTRGIPLKTGSARYYADWRLKGGVLGASATVQGISFGRGTELAFDEEQGKLTTARLHGASAIRGRTYESGTWLQFDDHRLVRTAFVRVDLDDSGRLERGVLATDCSIGGLSYEAGTVLRLADSGNVTEAYLPPGVHLTVRGATYKGLVRFHESGKPSVGILASDATVDGTAYRAGTLVEFLDNGRLAHAELSADTSVEGITYKAGTSVVFSYTFRTTEIWSRRADGGEFRATLSDYDRGEGQVKVSRGTLATDTAIQGTVYRAGSEIQFDASGRASALRSQ